MQLQSNTQVVSKASGEAHCTWEAIHSLDSGKLHRNQPSRTCLQTFSCFRWLQYNQKSWIGHRLKQGWTNTFKARAISSFANTETQLWSIKIFPQIVNWIMTRHRQAVPQHDATTTVVFSDVQHLFSPPIFCTCAKKLSFNLIRRDLPPNGDCRFKPKQLLPSRCFRANMELILF